MCVGGGGGGGGRSGGRSLRREEKAKVEGWLKKIQPKMTTQGRELVSLQHILQLPAR